MRARLPQKLLTTFDRYRADQVRHLKQHPPSHNVIEQPCDDWPKMSLIPRARLLALMQTQCRIFNTVFNPDHKRQGTKILRQRLKGPTFAAYYPRRTATIRSLGKYYPDYELMDDEEEDRLEKNRM